LHWYRPIDAVRYYSAVLSRHLYWKMKMTTKARKQNTTYTMNTK